VVDGVLPDELQRVILVALVHPDDPLGERHPEARRLVVAEKEEHGHLLVPDDVPRVMRTVVVVGAVEDILLPYGNVFGGEQPHLFRLVVLDVRRALEGVEVVLEQLRFLELGGRLGHHRRLRRRGVPSSAEILADAVHVPGNEL
jgi:hypothetical protein